LSPLFEPLALSPDEVDALTDFVANALYDPNLERYQPSQSEMPTGACVPNEDPASREALDCTGEGPDVPFMLEGLRLVNTEVDDQQWRFPEETVLAPGGVLIIARNATREEFEAHWGPLPTGVLFVSTGAHSSGAPIVNGGEEFLLRDATGRRLDGPSPTMTAAGLSMQREPDGGWKELSATAASPGRLMAGFDGQGAVITEISDGEGTGAYRFEFVEVGYFP
jgi:hypothetical protein